MAIQQFIDRTISALSQLPEEKAAEIADFADLILKKTRRGSLTIWYPKSDGGV